MSQRIPFNYGIYVKAYRSLYRIAWKVEKRYWPSFAPSNAELFRLTLTLEFQVRSTTFLPPLPDAFKQGTLRRKSNRDRLDKFLKSLEPR